MASYTSDGKLLVELPAILPADLTMAVRTQYITDASAEVDSRVGLRYSLSYNGNSQRFPDITDSPATPEIIEQAARWLAAARCYKKLGEINREPEGENAASRYERHAWDLLEKIRQGRILLVDSAGNDLAGKDPRLDSTTKDVDLDFTRGDYQEGSLVSDQAGTLDEF